MKTRIIQSLLFAVLLLPIIFITSKATEPDTIWTIGPNPGCWFSYDGTKILSELGECLDVSDGHVIWSDMRVPIKPQFTEDSLYYYDPDIFRKYRLSDGVPIDTGVRPRFKTIPDYFHDTNKGWTPPMPGNYTLGANWDTFYLRYISKFNDPTLNQITASLGLLCKYDRTVDSVVTYKKIIINGDTMPEYDMQFAIATYSKATNTILTAFLKNGKRTYRQYDATTLDSLNEFVYDDEKYGTVYESKLSYNGRYYAMGTSRGANNLGWIVVYDLVNNSIYKEIIGPDSSESIEFYRLAFSRNDSFLVASGGGHATTKTWNLHTGALIHTYEINYAGDESLDVSPDNTKIIAPNIYRTTLLRARWTPVTSIKDDNSDIDAMIVYPNPGTYTININIQAQHLKYDKVMLYSIDGMKIKELKNELNESNNNISIDCSGIESGAYLLRIESGETSRTIKIILNK